MKMLVCVEHNLKLLVNQNIKQIKVNDLYLYSQEAQALIKTTNGKRQMNASKESKSFRKVFPKSTNSYPKFTISIHQDQKRKSPLATKLLSLPQLFKNRNCKLQSNTTFLIGIDSLNTLLMKLIIKLGAGKSLQT